MFSHRRNKLLGILAGHYGNEFSLIGDIQRIEAEHLTSPADLRTDRDCGFINSYSDFGGSRQFIEGAGQSAAGRIAHTSGTWAHFERQLR